MTQNIVAPGIFSWQNANADVLPVHESEVLVSYDGVYHIAYFNKMSKKFHVKEDTSISIEIEGHSVYWSEIQDPDHVQ